MLFDYVYRCTQSSARAICILENNYKPANERYAERRKVEKGKRRRHTREYMHSHTYRNAKRRPLQRHYGIKESLRTIPEAESNQKLIRARARACVASVKNSKLLILIRASKTKKGEANCNEARRLRRCATSI